MNRLWVFIHGIRTGDLWLDADRRFVFQYAPDYLADPESHPISLSLPLRTEPLGDDAARPFFANLLPEGEIRDLIARMFSVSRKNDLGLLEKIGGECAGAVSVLPEGDYPKQGGDYLPLTEAELDHLTAVKPRKPLLVTHEELRLSLAGAQDKLPVFVRDGTFFWPSGDHPSSHILKPQNRYFPETVQNEAFCMMLARAVGLSVPEAFVYTGRQAVAYCVARYDRNRHSTGAVSRIHQEDFCQALSILPDHKYQSEGGPGFSDCFALLQRFSARPLIDRKRLMEWAVFNYLIGNADAHAKNISLLIRPKGIILAPFYDLMSTRVYPDLSPKMSMKIGKENRFDWVRRRHWERFADAAGVKPRFLMTRAMRMATDVDAAAEALSQTFVPENGGQEIVKAICAVVRRHKAHLEEC